VRRHAALSRPKPTLQVVRSSILPTTRRPSGPTPPPTIRRPRGRRSEGRARLGDGRRGAQGQGARSRPRRPAGGALAEPLPGGEITRDGRSRRTRQERELETNASEARRRRRRLSPLDVHRPPRTAFSDITSARSRPSSRGAPSARASLRRLGAEHGIVLRDVEYPDHPERAEHARRRDDRPRATADVYTIRPH
jgi:hypothetical protein